MKPQSNEFAAYYQKYIDAVEHDDALEALRQQTTDTIRFLQTISEEKSKHAYADGKWSIKEVLGHVLDTERVMTYRAMSIARGEKKSLPGFDQDDYVRSGQFNKRTWASLEKEYRLLRPATVELFSTFTEEAKNNMGVANTYDISVRALMFIIAGHELHHIKVIKEKYL